MLNFREISFKKWLFCAAGIVIVDQITKFAILKRFTEGERMNFTPFFDLTLAYNPGAAFSFLANAGGWQRWFFTVLAIVVSGVIVMWLRKETRTVPALGLTLVLGGAIGNVIDRIWLGKVIDFLLVYWKDWYYPAFNVADSAITCGAILLIFDSFFGKDSKEISKDGMNRV
jgi:signal peptidase II